MKDLKISISGVRGIFGKSLTTDLAIDFGRAFGTLLKKRKRTPAVLVGRDTRRSGQELKEAFFKGLTDIGCRIIDIEIAPTPTVILMTKLLHVDGGCVITASHNPAQWNGLKFIDRSGFFLDSKNMEELYSIYFKKNFNLAKNSKENIKKDFSGIDRHIKRILETIDAEKIKKKQFSVAIDCCNGAGSVITEKFLEKLGCNVSTMNIAPDGKFPHEPEPRPENIKEICAFLKKCHHDIGFVQDPDADRLAVVSERADALSEEDTLALAISPVLKKKKGSVVINLSTSKRTEDIASRLGAAVYRAKVGEVNVSQKMKEARAIIGGEGNGGVIFPKINFCRDSFVAMALILQYMAEENSPVSILASRIPPYFMIKDKFRFPTEKSRQLMNKFKRRFKKGKKDFSDGFRYEEKDFWFHIRPSNTEPVIRVVVEASNKKLADRIYKDIEKLIKS